MTLQLNPGAIFGGDYRIMQLLSQGGMGYVYIAEQISTGALRALKLMQPQGLESPSMRRRFEREARVGAQIESDYVVQVLGAGVDEATGVPWLAMELLSGEDLSHHVLQRGALSPAQTLDVFTPLCHAVAAAHDIGVVHRDLKPENIFLAKPRRPGERFTLKVLDFGIAKVLEDGRTQATGTVGTPLWMAPEQTSANENVTPSTDVWALGLLGFYLLTGKRYWYGANRARVTLPILLKELVIDPLELASVRAQKLDAVSLPPPEFDAWFSRCVARNRADRFANAREAYRPLVAILGGSTEGQNPLRDIGDIVSTPLLISELPPDPASDNSITRPFEHAKPRVPAAVIPHESTGPAASTRSTKSKSPMIAIVLLLAAILLSLLGTYSWRQRHRVGEANLSPADGVSGASEAPADGGGRTRRVHQRGWE